MTGRMVWIELRRSAALWAGLCALGVPLAFLYSVYERGPFWEPGMSWTSQWSTYFLWSRFLLVLVLPVVAGAGAMLGMRDQRSKMTELVGTMPRPSPTRAAVSAGALAIAVVVGYLVLTVIAAVQIIGNDGTFFVGALPAFLVGLVAVVAAALVGMGLGRVLPSGMTPPLVSGAGLIVTVSLFVATNGQRGGADVVPAWVRLLSPVEDSLRNPWLVITGAVSFGQLAWLLGLASTGFVLVAATRRTARLAAIVPLLVGLGLAVAVFPARLADAHAVDPAAAQQVCDGAVCVTALHEPQLAQVKGPVAYALRKLARLPNAPTRAEELVPDLELDDVVEPQPASTLYISLDEPTLKAAPEQVEEWLLTGAGTPACPDPQAGNSDADAGQRATAARHMAGVWLVGGTDPTATLMMPYGKERVEALIRPAWDALMKASENEQRARVAALRDSGLACDGRDLLAILADGTGAGR